MGERDITIRTLLGHSQIETAVVCLGSLLRHCRDSVRLVIHEDGTLTEEDADRLRGVLRDTEIVWRSDADAELIPLLKNFPTCLEYRRNHALALKLFDVCVLSRAEETMTFCDSDVLFLRNFHFSKPVQKGEVLFMQDSELALSLRPWNVRPLGPLRVLHRVNSGFISVSPGDLDLDFVESILGNPTLAGVFKKRPQWVEQTCWAALGARLSASFLDSEQVFVAYDGMGAVTERQVAIHFVSSHRGKLDAYVRGAASVAPACHLGVVPAKAASMLDLVRGEWTVRKSRKQLLKSWAESV